jgi:nucleotide-binding universal stress UspA family protein
MTYQSILVHLDGRPCGAETLRVACRLATRFHSHLAAVFAARPVRPVASVMDPAAAVDMAVQADAELALQAEAAAQTAAAEAWSGLAIEWRKTSLDAIGGVAVHARHADLLVMSQDDPGWLIGPGPSLAAGVIMGAGRPVLLVPGAGGFQTCGNSVLLAWNASRESARAAADALPLLKTARQVNVVWFDPDRDAGRSEIPAADVGLWLARHDVRATVRQRQSADADVGDQLLALAAELGSDLLIMGAYEDSRACETVLGGATRRILHGMAVPALMSH